jgi:hypothetical protein
MTGRDYSRSRAVLIGNGTFTEHEKIPAVPAPGCVAAMLDLLTSDLCGWPRDRISLFEDLPNPADLARVLVRAVREAEDVLLVYYVGHGMLTMTGDLVLALGDTEADPEALPYTGMPYASLAGIMRGSTAMTKLVILDCCYAETANQAVFGTQSADLADAYPVDGLYFIGASKRREKAGFPLYGDLTYFTEAFIETVRAGIPGSPPAPELTLAQIFSAVRARLAASGLPEPADSGIRDARQYPFAGNAALSRPASAKPEDPARAARLRLLDYAEQAASPDGLSGHYRIDALLAIAAAAAPDDPDRTRRLTSEAMRLVAAGTLEPYLIVSIAAGLAAVSPKRAEQIAAALQEYRDEALAEVATVIAASDPDRAERVVSLIGDARMKDSALAGAVKTSMTSAPDQAEHFAGMISDPYTQASTLAEIAAAIAASSPRRAEAMTIPLADDLPITAVEKVAESLAQVDLEAAERVARSLTEQEDRDRALRRVAIAAAPRDLNHARRIITDIATPRDQGRAAYHAAICCAKDTPDLAGEIARAIPDPRYRSWALHAIARDVAETDPDRAAQLLAGAEQACQAITDPADHDRDLASVASAVAATDLDRALRITSAARTPGGRADALYGVAVAAAGTSYHQAQRIAAMIPDAGQQARALIGAAAVAAKKGDADSARRLLEEAKTLASAVSDVRARAFLLADTAVALATVAPDDARRTMDEAEIAGRTIPDAPSMFSSKPRNEALRQIAWTAFSQTSSEARAVLRDHAERIARAIPGREEQASVLTWIAVALVSEDLDRAERAALAIIAPERRIRALLALHAEFTSSP